MSVQSNLVRTTIVETIRERALARVNDSLPGPVSEVLDTAARPDLSRAGYFSRAVETELFAPAREPASWLEQRLRAVVDADEMRRLERAGAPWPPALCELAAGLADREPSERPDPDDPDAVTWRIPGPGGHVRHYVALALIGDHAEPALKRDVIYGFVVRCCDEVVAGGRCR